MGTDPENEQKKSEQKKGEQQKAEQRKGEQKKSEQQKGEQQKGEQRDAGPQRSRLGWDDARGPSDDEIEAWAVAERKRRESWLAGPSDDEKRRWARAERWRRTTGAFEATGATRRLYRDAELAGMGLLFAIAWAPFAAFSELMRLGARWEEGYTRPHRPHRVLCDDDAYQTEGTSRYRTRSRYPW